jgi:hypothetical protein
MTCTWKDCTELAVHPQKTKYGEVWANLCTQHNSELEQALTGTSARAILRCWVLGGGGADKMAARMTG